jgi:peptidoglycan hydrolase-like protein with peptidoglycan-binding domain
MPNSTVLWCGPVNLTQVPGATVPGAFARALPCTADGSPSCSQIADSWKDADGRRLPRLLQKVGRDEGAVGDLFLGAFSAGGSVIKRLLLHEADRAPIRAVLLADATYTDWASPGNPLAPEGFVLFCLDALHGGKLFVATASASSPGNNKTLPSGVVGLKLGADGAFGPNTEAAVKAFQKWAGLGADGIVGPKTLASLAQALESGAHIP